MSPWNLGKTNSILIVDFSLYRLQIGDALFLVRWQNINSNSNLGKSMQWDDIIRLHPIYFNLGGGRCSHPSRWYRNYVSIDQKPRSEWSIQHDLTTPFPLPDHTVDRILTEDFLEHLELGQIESLLKECYRILKPGCFMRIGVPDYRNPKDRICLEAGKDPLMTQHKTLTHYDLMQEVVANSPFEEYEFYQYWLGDQYIWKPVDYSLGIIRRSPENFYRVYMKSFWPIVHYSKDLLTTFFKPGLKKRNENSAGITYGHPLFTTELVVDLRKI